MTKTLNIAMLVSLLISVLIVFLGYKKQMDIKNIQYEQISRILAKSQIQYESERRINKNAKEIWDIEKKYLENRISQLSSTSLSLKNQSNISKKSDLSYNDKYIINELHFKDNDILGPPIGYIMTYSDGRVVSKIYKHHIDVEQIQSINDKTGELTVLNKANFILDQAGLANREDSEKDNWVGKAYPLNVLNSKILVNKQSEKTFKFFDPKLDLGLDVTNLGPSVGIGLSLSKWGNARIFRAGINKNLSGSKNILLNFSPFEYNPTKVLKNTYIRPTFGFSDVEFAIGGGLSVNF